MSKVTFDLPAGIKVKNKVSGVEGTITCRIERINGCLQYHICTVYGEDGKRIAAGYSDLEDLEVLDWNGKSKDPETIDFEFETGDRVKNRINEKVGIITVRRIDSNGCISYWYENSEQDDKGDMLEFYGFEQEFILVDSGLNKSDEPPVKRQRTGCNNDIESPSKY